jgi:hypothetical protein
MENCNIPAKGHFKKERKDLLEFLGFTRYELEKVSKKSKEDFSNNFPDADIADYERYMHLNDLFKKTEDLSYIEFSDMLNSEYGFYLNEIKRNENTIISNNLSIVKNLLIFFTIIWGIGVLVAASYFFK